MVHGGKKVRAHQSAWNSRTTPMVESSMPAGLQIGSQTPRGSGSPASNYGNGNANGRFQGSVAKPNFNKRTSGRFQGSINHGSRGLQSYQSGDLGAQRPNANPTLSPSSLAAAEKLGLEVMPGLRGSSSNANGNGNNPQSINNSNSNGNSSSNPSASASYPASISADKESNTNSTDRPTYRLQTGALVTDQKRALKNQPGRRVALKNLYSSSGKDFNNTYAVLLEYNESLGRWLVALEALYGGSVFVHERNFDACAEVLNLPDIYCRVETNVDLRNDVGLDELSHYQENLKVARTLLLLSF